MTGYGKAVGEYEGRKITVEIKSLNSKQLDLLTRMPVVYREKEMAVRNELSQSVERGKVEFSVSIDNVGTEKSQKLNVSVIETYYTQLREVAENLGIPQPTDWFATLLRVPDVFKSDSQEFSEEEWSIVSSTMTLALDAFNEFRIQEGEALAKIFQQKLDNIASLLAQIECYEKERVEKIKNRLHESLESLSVDYNKDRFEQELIFYIEKLDISEEKVRLKNHLKYFAETSSLALDIWQKKLDNINRPVLSMGMSDSFSAAIACGSTVVRVGRRLFAARGEN